MTVTDRIIVDASVACKWFFLEEGTSRADLLAGQRLAALELMFTEVANIVWKNLRARKIELEDAKAVMAKLALMPIQLHDSRVHLPLALEIAATCDRTIYDALYVALAEVENTYVVTADMRLFNAFANTKWAGRVHIL